MKKANYLKSLLLMLALLLSATVDAHDFEVDGIYYRISGNQVSVTFRGSSWDSYSEYDGVVEIPASVTYNGTTYSVSSIGYDAFHGNSNLISVIIPNSVTVMEVNAFSGCTKLTNIDIPTTVTSIGDDAFRDCTGLTSIEIPKSVTTIGRHILYNCYNIRSISVESGNTSYDSRDNCNSIIETSTNTLITGCQNSFIPNTITSISDFAFRNCVGLTSIEIPNSVKSIGYAAFAVCKNLTRIDIPNSMISIGGYAFSGCTNLTNITFSNSVTYIGKHAFRDTPWYNNQPDGLIYAGLVVYGYKGSMPYGTTIIIEDGTLGIAGYAFGSCDGLVSIDIPNSVVSIGEEAFEYCSNLTYIDIPNSVSNIGDKLFVGCSNLTSIEIPKTVFTIGQHAFSNCPKLKTVFLGDSITDIALNAFQGSTSIDNVYCYSQIPPNSTDQVFADYSGTLHVPATALAAYFTAPCWRNFENIIGDAIPPTDITINKDSLVIIKGEQFTLSAFVTPTNASSQNITWKSTNTNIATVNNGYVTSVGVGECEILAFCNGMQASCHISVVEQLITITLDQQEAMLLPNHILTLTPTPLIPEIYVVSSSDPTVAAARVLSGGKVQIVGIKEGTTTITVGSADGTAIPATCLVTVYTESGDLNSDGFVTIGDVTSLIDYLLGGDVSSVTIKNADVNGDGIITISDVTSLIDTLLSKTE